MNKDKLEKNRKENMNKIAKHLRDMSLCRGEYHRFNKVMTPTVAGILYIGAEYLEEYSKS